MRNVVIAVGSRLFSSRALAGLFVVGFVLFAAWPVQACKCREPDEMQLITHAKWIFQGTVESSSSDHTEFHVRVSRVWRGPKVGDSVKFVTSDSDCGIPLQKGYELIVAATPDDKGVVGVELCGDSVVAIGKVREAEVMKQLGSLKATPAICACAKEMPQPRDAMKSAETIFQAKVIAEEKPGRWRLQVGRGFKNGPKEGTEIVYSADPTGCGFPTVAGVDVIVSGARNKDGSVTANPCIAGHTLWTGPEIVRIGEWLDEAK